MCTASKTPFQLQLPPSVVPSSNCPPRIHQFHILISTVLRRLQIFSIIAPTLIFGDSFVRPSDPQSTAPPPTKPEGHPLLPRLQIGDRYGVSPATKGHTLLSRLRTGSSGWCIASESCNAQVEEMFEGYKDNSRQGKIDLSCGGVPILVRVIRIWEARNFKRKHELMSLNCLLLDEKVRTWHWVVGRKKKDGCRPFCFNDWSNKP